MRIPLRSRTVAAVATVVTALLMTGCGSESTGGSATAADAAEPAADTPTTYVGTVEGTDAFVAVQGTGADTLVYLCDGQKIWSYLDGELADGSLQATAPGGPSLDATLDDGELAGTVTLEDGAVHEFRAVEATGDAGLFALATAATDDYALGSWIRLPDGEVRGKNVTVAQTGEEPPVGVDDGGGGVPPEADPVPANRVSLVRCAIATIRGSKALKAVADNPSAANQAALDAARAAVAASCHGGAGATS